MTIQLRWSKLHELPLFVPGSLGTYMHRLIVLEHGIPKIRLIRRIIESRYQIVLVT